MSYFDSANLEELAKQQEQDRLLAEQEAKLELLRQRLSKEYLTSECTQFTLPESGVLVKLKEKNAITPKFLIEFDLVPCTLVNIVNKQLAFEYNLQIPPPSSDDVYSEESILFRINEASKYLLPEEVEYATVSDTDAWAIRQYIQGQFEKHISDEYATFACGPYKIWMQSFHEAPYVIIDKLFPELIECPIAQYDLYMAGAAYRYFFTAEDKAESLKQMATIMGASVG
jgi:hypothetical protein